MLSNSMRCAFGVVCCIALAAAPATAQLDWGYVSTFGSPDPILLFDLANPGVSTNLGFVDGNFNRSMDFATRDSFYHFVSTDALNDPGDRGLWYWTDGVSTQLTTIGFSDSGDGDGTLSNDQSRYYVSVEDEDATGGHSLYAFEDLNGAVSFVEIGETGLTQLIGIAMDPVSGDLYGYDSNTEALYIISQKDGTPTLVGSSGATLGGIGGMDFSDDGSVLLLVGGDDLFRVNKSDGTLTSAGTIDGNASALSFRPVPEPSGTLLLLTLIASAVYGPGRQLRLERR